MSAIASPSPPPVLARAAASAPTPLDASASAKPMLQRKLSLRHEARSPRTFWMSRARDVELELSLDALTIAAENSPSRERIAWEDVLGAHILNDAGEHLTLPVDLATVATSKSYVVAVFAFPAKRGLRDGKLKKRQLREWIFRFPGTEMSNVVPLVTSVNYLADPRSYEAMRNVTTLDELTPITRANRKFFVVVNPVGGAGNAVSLFQTKVAPLFKYACIDVEVQHTHRASHGVDIAESLPLGVYDCLVTVGGDGSLCEIVQGLMKRPDWKDAIQQPLGVVPGGSGNGMFSSLMHDLGEQYKPALAGFVLAKGVPHALDITAVRNPHGESIYSFLSSEWAFIADIDVESENLRALGGARFTVKTIQNLFFSKKTYEGELWYLEEDTARVAPLVPHDAGDGTVRPGFELFDGLDDGTVVTDGSNAKWKKTEGNFHLVWIMNITHASSDALIAPGAALDDGYNYVVVLDGTRPRSELTSAFLGIETGKHVEVDGVRVIKTRAFKIVPARPDDLICVDGEVFRGPIEAQVHHKVARIVTLPRAAACADAA